jgi:hypothetical protein
MSIVSGHPSSHDDAACAAESFRREGDDQLDLFPQARDRDSEASKLRPAEHRPAADGRTAVGGFAAATNGADATTKPKGSVEDDLRRLAESVRWLQSETTACRLPRATQLRPVDGLPAVAPDRYGDDPVDPYEWTQLKERPAVEAAASERVVQATVRRRAVPRRIAMLLMACGGVVAFWLVNDQAGMDHGPAIRVAAAPPQADLTAQFALRPGLPADDSISAWSGPAAADTLRSPPANAIDASVGPDAVEARGSSGTPEGEPAPGIADKAPAEAAAEGVTQQDASAVEPSTPVTRKEPPKAALRASEIASLLERGKIYFEAGDIAAARLLFRRAADAGDASAAVAMGSTYDPAVLTGHFVHGVEANADKARAWYEKARDLGSPEGPRRLEMLARQ